MRWLKRYPWVASSLVLLATLFAFGLSLDRYPPFYVDEPFYNYPSISYLNGDGFVYRHSAGTPHGDRLFAYNSPFFLRLQFLTFALFGPALASWRWPEYVCGLLGNGLLSFHLIRHGRPISGAILPVVWAGDRSLMELMLGRPDGVCLLFLIVAFVLLIRIGQDYSARATWAAGLCVGIACGFHFSAASFVLAAWIAVALAVPFRRLPGATAWFLLGGLVPLATVLWCWAPHLKEAVEQLLWHVRLPMGDTYGHRFVRFFAVLGWSRFWVVALLTGWLALGALAVGDFRRRDAGGEANIPKYDRLMTLTSFLFGTAGVVAVFAPRAVLPYYLIYFSCWPVAGLLSRLEGEVARGQRRAALIVLSLALAAAWLSSFAWNLMRFRENMLFHSALDHDKMISLLRSAVPAGAAVYAEPELIAAAVESGLTIVRPQWANAMDAPPEGAYLLLTESGYTKVAHAHPDSFGDREIAYRGALFPDAGPLGYRIVVMSPSNRSGKSWEGRGRHPE